MRKKCIWLKEIEDIDRQEAMIAKIEMKEKHPAKDRTLLRDLHNRKFRAFTKWLNLKTIEHLTNNTFECPKCGRVFAKRAQWVVKLDGEKFSLLQLFKAFERKTNKVVLKKKLMQVMESSSIICKSCNQRL